MTAISAAELAAMRAVADDFFPDTCTIQTATVTVDATGSPILTYSNTYTNVACRIDPASRPGGGRENVINLALESESKWALNIPYTQAIGVTDRVIHNGLTYEVEQVMTSQSYATISRAAMVRVNG